MSPSGLRNSLTGTLSGTMYSPCAFRMAGKIDAVKDNLIFPDEVNQPGIASLILLLFPVQLPVLAIVFRLLFDT